MNDSVSLNHLSLCDINQRTKIGGQHESIKGEEFSLKLIKEAEFDPHIY